MTQADWSDTSKVRDTFVEFFKDKCQHDFIPSSPVIPHDDNSLLFINAGMNQFKPIFVGTVDPNSAFGKLKRACNSQKCIRAGGKHNDLEDVGKDSYHHTFFEMLGNWSFGDYFKQEAIDWAWELLTQVYQLDPSRIYVTYFGGDPSIPTCQPDYEARDLWAKYLPSDRVLPFGAKENFWEMAETGPCGPCSEIHYDRIGNRFVADKVNQDDPNVVEIWNLVFMQYNREKDRSLTPLPFGSVDTGMGMERLASILINKPSNYDIHFFQHIFRRIQACIPALADRPYQGLEGLADEEGIDMAYRVVADHIRTLSIAIADGALPSNDGRGYVLRRILRRAIRYGRQKLNAPMKPWFYQISCAVAETLGDAFPALRERLSHVEAIIFDEERQFGVTLERGLREFDRVLQGAVAARSSTFPGGAPGAFSLFTTYGFPLDLTQLMAEEKGLKVDMGEYEKEFEDHRQKARDGNKKKGGVEILLQQEQLHYLSATVQAPATEDASKYEWDSFQGAGRSVEATVVAIFDGKTFHEEVRSDMELPFGVCGLVLDKTNFYAEAGGQVSDVGRVTATKTEEMEAEDNFSASVDSVQRFGAYILHTVQVENGTVKVGEKILCEPDFALRSHIAKNHTATHILNYALRRVLGKDCDQKGSLVDAQRLRFDYSHGKPLELEELVQVEEIVRKAIQEQRGVDMRSVALEEAFKIKGLRAIFGEQYPDPVRVVSLSRDGVDALVKDCYEGQGGEEASIEFCGGTHVKNTGEIEKFVIMSEEGIAKGVRRLVAYTGEGAKAVLEKTEEMRKKVEEVKKLEGGALATAIASLRGQLDVAVDVSYIEKKRWLGEVDEMKTRLVELSKQRTKELLGLAKGVATEIGKALEEGDKEKYHFSMDSLQGDSKAIDACVKGIEGLKLAKSFYCLLTSFNEENGVVSCVSFVNGTSSVDAKEFLLKNVVGPHNGKGGGKATKAIGSIDNFDKEKYQKLIPSLKALF